MSKTENIYNNRLRELHSSGFEIMDGEPDIRNWKAIASQNQEIGRITELLFDEISHRVRYLVVDVNGKPLNLVSRIVLIPIGLAELNKPEKVVSFPRLTVGHIASLPVYPKGKITLETERAIRSVFAPTNGISYKDQDFNDPENFYDHEHFDENQAYRPRTEVIERTSLKDEIKENIEKVKESVRKMESDLEKLGHKDF